MIETTKRILRKLINAPEKYQTCMRYGFYTKIGETITVHKYDIYWNDANLSFILGINVLDNTISWTAYGDNRCGKENETTLPEDDKYEILDLCQKLKRKCENYTSTMFRNFADESDNESGNDLE